MNRWEIVQDQSESRIFGFLRNVDCDFCPPLSSRVDLAEYAKKLSLCATNLFAISRGVDVGHVAFYSNDLINKRAFLSSVSLKKEVRGSGLALYLLEEVFSRCKSDGAGSVYLKVDERNARAVEFYRKNGFKFCGIELMKLNL